MTAGPNQGKSMRVALRRFLSDTAPKRARIGSSNEGVTKEICEKIAAVISGLAPGTSSTPLVRNNVDDHHAANVVTVIFSLVEKHSTARIEIPAILVKALFTSCSGGCHSGESYRPAEQLTQVERHFQAMFADEVAHAVAGVIGHTIVREIVYPGETVPDSQEAMETSSVLVSVCGIEAVLAVHLPIEQPADNKVPGVGPTLADSASHLPANVEIRLRLSEMTLSTIAALRPGDILSMSPEPWSSTAELAVQGATVMTCELGQIAGRYSARVVAPSSVSQKRNQNNKMVLGGL